MQLEADGLLSEWESRVAALQGGGLEREDAERGADETFAGEYPAELARDQGARDGGRYREETLGEDGEAALEGMLDKVAGMRKPGAGGGRRAAVKGVGPDSSGRSSRAMERGTASAVEPSESAAGGDVAGKRSVREDFQWVFYNLANRETLKREDAPSDGAWYLLEAVNGDKDLKRDFLRQMAQRFLSLKDAEREQRYRDDGRETMTVINDLLAARERSIQPAGAKAV